MKSIAYLGSTITRKGVIPQGLVWTLNWNLVAVITMCKRSGSQEGSGNNVGEHDCVLYEEKDEQLTKGKEEKRNSQCLYGTAVLSMLRCTHSFGVILTGQTLQQEATYLVFRYPVGSRDGSSRRRYWWHRSRRPRAGRLLDSHLDFRSWSAGSVR